MLINFYYFTSSIGAIVGAISAIVAVWQYLSNATPYVLIELLDKENKGSQGTLIPYTCVQVKNAGKRKVFEVKGAIEGSTIIGNSTQKIFLENTALFDYNRDVIKEMVPNQSFVYALCNTEGAKQLSQERRKFKLIVKYKSRVLFLSFKRTTSLEVDMHDHYGRLRNFK